MRRAEEHGASLAEECFRARRRFEANRRRAVTRSFCGVLRVNASATPVCELRAHIVGAGIDAGGRARSGWNDRSDFPPYIETRASICVEGLDLERLADRAGEHLASFSPHTIEVGEPREPNAVAEAKIAAAIIDRRLTLEVAACHCVILSCGTPIGPPHGVRRTSVVWAGPRRDTLSRPRFNNSSRLGAAAFSG